MAKAMLISEMPTSCDVCEYVDNSDPRALWCGIPSYQMNVTDYVACRHESCPLREVPSKHEDGHTLKVAIENDCYDDTVQDDAWCEGVDKGYNACIDEILGGTE